MNDRGEQQRAAPTASRHPLIPLPGGPIVAPGVPAESLTTQELAPLLFGSPGLAEPIAPLVVADTPPLEIVLAIPSGLFADGFARSLAQLPRGVRVHRCDPLEQPPQTLNPGLIIVDLDAAFQSPTDLIARFVAAFPATPVIALAAVLDSSVLQAALRAGARMVVSKAHDEAHALGILREVLQDVYAKQIGEPGAQADGKATSEEAGSRKQHTPYRLTSAELDVLSYLCDGLTNLETAIRRNCAEGSIKCHLHSIYRKLKVRNAKQAIPIGRNLPEVQALQRGRSGTTRSMYDWLLEHMKTERKNAGDILFRKGAPADKLYFVQEGSVLLVEIDKRMGAADWIGEIGIFSEKGTRTCTAQCETSTRVFWLAYEEAKQLFYEQPQFAYYITQLIANRLREDSERAQR